MKNFIIAIVLVFISLPSLASNPETKIDGIPACHLYNNLNIDEEIVSIFEFPFEMYSKVLSGLTCNYWENTGNKYLPGCECIFSKDITFFERECIYFAVDVFEKSLDNGETQIFTKSVDSLDFHKIVTLEDEEETVEYLFSVFEEFN